MSTETTPEASPRRSRRSGALGFLRDLVIVVVIALVVSFLVKTFVVRSFYIPSASMELTLQVQDRILVDALTPNWNDYERGDVVVFADPGGWLPPSPESEDGDGFFGAIDSLLTFIGLGTGDSDEHLVKRIIGLPGDRVVCCNDLGQLTINGVGVNELAYLHLPQGDRIASDVEFDVTVPEDSLWVLGDNRDRSQDSRFQTEQPGKGFVPIDNVVGRAFLRTWPLDRLGTIDMHHEVFNGVPDAAFAGE